MALTYRPALDGLRSIAVGSVFLFHFNHLLPGGFTGVDIFFVISGFLISSIIIKDCSAENFSFLQFYQRRIARIFPAFFTVIIATLLASALVYSPQDFASAGASAAAATLSVINMKLIYLGNYFEVIPDAQPLLHYWSLSVEEQFYLLFPPLLWFLYRRKISPKKILVILSGLFLVSLAACVLLTAKYPTFSFYSLPTRAWELIVGCGLALFHNFNRAPLGRSVVHALSVVGLMVIVGSVCFIPEGNQFPGWLALFPVLGTALIIGPGQHQDGPIEKLLAHPLPVWIGKMSYSLYLWHWPVFCLVDYHFYTSGALVREGLKLFLAISLATASYYLIENPSRIRLNERGNRRWTFSLAAIAVVVLPSAGSLIRRNNYPVATLGNVSNGGVVVPGPADRPLIVLMGDSTAAMYGGTIKQIASELHLRANIIGVPGGGIPLPSPRPGLWEKSMAFISRERPRVVVLGFVYSNQAAGRRFGLKSALEELLKHCEYVIILKQIPKLPLNGNRSTIRERGMMPFFEVPAARKLRLRIDAFIDTLASDRVLIVETEAVLRAPTGEIRFADDAGRQLYHDLTHLSAHGSALVKPSLRNAIERTLE